MSEKIFINIFKVLIFLIPVGLITGPFIPDLAITLMAFLFILLSIKNNLWKKYYDNNIVKFLFIINIYLIFISLFSDNLYLSLKSSIFYFRFLLASIAIWFLLDHAGYSFKKNLTVYMMLIFLCLSLDAIYQYKFGENIIGLKPLHIYRISSFFGDQLVLGSYQSRLLILLMGLYMALNIFNKNIYFISLFFLFTICSIFLSGERTSFALLLISISLFLFLTKFSSKIFVPILLSICLVLFISYFDKQMRYRIFIEPLHQSNLASEKLLKIYETEKKSYIHDDKKILIFSKEHNAHYNTALKIFLDNTIIGIGPKMYRIKCSDEKYISGNESCSTHPHNVLMQILSETGLVGLILYLIIIYFIVSEIVKIYRNQLKSESYIQLGCLILFFINLFPFVPSGNIFNNWLSVIFYFPLGFYLYSSNYKIEKNRLKSTI
tara:strand:- start:167 stop:1471 length:1305 start_codon:yes stop_codon:yes gene_type:complete